MINGIPFDFNGKTYIVPTLSLGAMQAMRSKLDTFEYGVTSTSVETVLDCLYAAMKRNYPELTRDVVAEFIDLGNMDKVMEAVMDHGGVRRKALEAPPATDQGVDDVRPD